jgi:hypothetical protein
MENPGGRNAPVQRTEAICFTRAEIDATLRLFVAAASSRRRKGLENVPARSISSNVPTA